MINSIYFTALLSNRPINLDWLVVVCCQLVKPIVVNETFSHVVYFDNQTNDLVKAQTMILASWSKSRAKQSGLTLGFKSATI
jgi:hypothetical protein